MERIEEKKWLRMYKGKGEEIREVIQRPDISEMIRSVLREILDGTSHSVVIKKIIAEKNADAKRPETEMHIAMLKTLRSLFQRKMIQCLLLEELQKDEKECRLFDLWEKKWTEQQLQKLISTVPKESLSFEEVLAALAAEPEIPEEYQDDPEEHEAHEHAAACHCGYGCQRFDEDEEVSLEEIQKYVCEPIDILQCLDSYDSLGYFNGIVSKEWLPEKLRCMYTEEGHPWVLLRKLVEEISFDAFTMSNSLREQENCLHTLECKLSIIGHFTQTYFPFVTSSVSVQRFCRAFLAASNEIQVRLERIWQAREQLQQTLLAELAKHELPPGYLDKLPTLPSYAIDFLEEKLSNIQLAAQFKKCETRSDFLSFLEQEVGIPDQKWRTYTWLIGSSKKPLEEGGMGRDLRWIVDCINADPRFGKHAIFRDWMDEIPLKTSCQISNKQQALDLLQKEALTLGTTIEAMADPENFVEFVKQSKIFAAVMKYLGNLRE